MNSQFWCFNNIILLSSSTAMFTILQTVIVCAISYALWKLRRRFFIKLALDNIPGPPSQSFLFGEFFWIPDLWNRHLVVYSISRCFSTAFRRQRMGISQIYWTEMYHDEYFSTLYEQDADASQMVALSRSRPFLAYVLFFSDILNWSWS